MTGFQIGGINDTQNTLGLQTGLWNNAEKNLKGFQTGLVNSAGYALGLQFGGINVAEEVGGFQLGGWNKAEKKMNGFQVGAVNEMENGVGLQFINCTNLKTVHFLFCFVPPSQLKASNFFSHVDSSKLQPKCITSRVN
jgi:hypothetical protein